MKSKKVIVGILIFVIFTFQNGFAQVVINEFLAVNTAHNVDQRDYYQYNDWVELYNSGSETVDLSGFSITDNFNELDKFTFPEGTTLDANKYLLIWTDDYNKFPGDRDTIYYNAQVVVFVNDYHANFKISSEGEELALVDTAGVIVDSIVFGKQLGDVSFGRKLNNITEWAYFGQPTPGAANSTIAADEIEYTASVSMSPSGGSFVGGQTISLQANPGETIRYTTDGSKPNESSTIYTGPIAVNSTKVIKARAFQTNKISNEIATQTYIINASSNLPTISVVANYSDLWSFNYGIYQNNFKDREIPVYLEYFNPEGQKEFGVGAGAELFGSNIFLLDQKPMSFQMKGKYGDDELAFPLFSERGEVLYKDFVLRNGGNDNGKTFFRDALVMSMIKDKMDLDYQAFQPASVYLNGNYWGLFNLREKLNEEYLLYTHNVNPDQVNILEDNVEVNQGSNTSFLSFLNYLENNDLSIDENYEYASSLIDMNGYMDYKAIKLFIGYIIDDFNLKYWQKADDGKWRYMAFDLEHSFGEHTGELCESNSIETVTSPDSPVAEWGKFIFNKFLENDKFKNAFVNRFISHLNTTFLPENVIGIVDELQALYAPEMVKHIQKWSTDPNAIQSINDWLAAIEDIREYAQCRPAYMYQYLLELLETTDTSALTVHNPSIDTAQILINGVAGNQGEFTQAYPTGSEMEIIVIPAIGYNLSGWNGTTSSDTITFVLDADSILIPSFETEAITTLSDTILNDLTLTAANSPYHITDDIIIPADVTLTIEPGVQLLLADRANIINYGSLLMNGSENSPILLESDPSPNARRPYFNTTPNWGAIVIQDATGLTRISNAVIKDATVGHHRYLEKATISAFDSEVVLEHVNIPDAVQPFYSEFGDISISNCNFRSELTGDLINIKYATAALVEDCDLQGNEAVDMDAIDFDGLNNGIIRNNKIYNFLGGNSDAIDLGENATNVLIEGNEISNITDKGISIGQNSDAIISRNVIARCALGIGIKDEGSFGEIDHNTFYNTGQAVSIYEKNAGVGGGSAAISNTIMAQSTDRAVFVDELSSVTIKYSLSDTEELEGEGNLQADPKFVNAAIGNYELQSNSPCIDAGDPNYAFDPDNSRTDMGAYYTHQNSGGFTIVINEVNYNASDCDIEDWVEFYNYGTQPINLNGWKFTDENNEFVLPNVTIGADGYVVLCRDLANFEANYSGVTPAGVFDFGLKNSGELLQLLDASSNVVAGFVFEDTHPWPQGADGYCNSMELYHPFLDMSVGGSWHTSYVEKGSPGAANTEIDVLENVYLNELMAVNDSSIADEFGEFEDWIEIYNDNSNAVDLGGLYITDDLSDLFKWRITRTNKGQLEVNGMGYFLLWADEDLDQGLRHVDLKLSSTSGEDLALVQVTKNDTIILDQTTFGPQTSAASFGQYGDGMGNWQLLDPTPNATNEQLSVGLQEAILSQIKIYPNPSSDFIQITLENLPERAHTIEVVNTLGMVMSKEIVTGNRIDVQDLSAGIYQVILHFDDFKVAKSIVVQ